MRAVFGCALACLALGFGGGALAQSAGAPKEIKIGQTLPYSGPLSSFGVIGRTQEAFFAKINAEGGINGRQIKFISLDDAYSPPKTVEHTRKLVEQDDVLFVFGALGTATNNAVHRYLNSRKVPQLFVLSGASKWNDPKAHPWTMPGMVAYDSEGAVYAKYILSVKPNAKIAILSQNDDFGRDYVTGFKRALGAKASSMIVAEQLYEPTAPTIGSQIAALKASGADVLFGVTLGKFTSQLVKGIADVNWKPDLTFVPTSSSSIAILEPAGLENAVGLISASYQKDVNDAQWADAPDVKAYFAFMKDMMPGADLKNTNYAAGYLYASLVTHILRACGDDFSRENILRQATSMKDAAIPLLLPGTSVTTGPDDYLVFQQLQLRRFTGKNWEPFGELIDDR